MTIVQRGIAMLRRAFGNFPGEYGSCRTASGHAGQAFAARWIGRAAACMLLGVVVVCHAQQEITGGALNPLVLNNRMPMVSADDIDGDSPSLGTDHHNPFASRSTINHPFCRMGTGYEQAAGLAVIVMPGTVGRARFAVLDGTGTLFDGELPFMPNNHALGRREDGSVLVGFGGRVPDKESILRASPKHAEGPVRIFRDDRMVFASDGVWQFDIAPDGSSFFALEPIARRAAKLTIHDTATGAGNRFDIVDQMQYLNDVHQQHHYGRASFNKGAWRAAYSLVENEVLLASTDYYSDHDRRLNPSTRSGGYFFHPAGAGQYRFNIFGHAGILFESSHQGYFADRCRSATVVEGRLFQGSETTISKKALRWNGITELEQTVVWSRSLDLDGFSGMNLSDDGAYLVLRAANMHVLNTATGETVFAFPTERNLGREHDGSVSHWQMHGPTRSKLRLLRETPVARAYYKAALARLADFLPPDATHNDIELGGPVTIRQGRLAMTHRISHIGEVLYLFDMDGMKPNDAPKARVELSRPVADKACVMGNIPEQGLQIHDGKLTYLTERLSFEAD